MSLSVPLSSPLSAPLVGAGGYAFQNATAEAVAALRNAAGENLSNAQAAALDAFHIAKAAASGTWGAAIKRLWMPGTAKIEAANAIDLIGGNTGTFVGDVTHGAGVVTGDGSTGYFAADASLASLGVTGASACLFRHVVQEDSTNGGEFHLDGTADTSGAERFNLGDSSTADFCGFACPIATANAFVATDRDGIFIGSATATNSRFIGRRDAAGYSQIGLNTDTSAGALSDLTPYFMARNNNGTADGHTDAALGAYGIGTGLSNTDAAAFTLALQALAEAFTGNSLA